MIDANQTVYYVCLNAAYVLTFIGVYRFPNFQYCPIRVNSMRKYFKNLINYTTQLDDLIF